jgi:hypothetical protein
MCSNFCDMVKFLLDVEIRIFGVRRCALLEETEKILTNFSMLKPNSKSKYRKSYAQKTAGCVVVNLLGSRCRYTCFTYRTGWLTGYLGEHNKSPIFRGPYAQIDPNEKFSQQTCFSEGGCKMSLNIPTTVDTKPQYLT